MRHFPRWAASLPAHRQRIVPAAKTAVVVSAPAVQAAEPWQWQHGVDHITEGSGQ
jgi:hypothetical protein